MLDSSSVGYGYEIVENSGAVCLPITKEIFKDMMRSVTDRHAKNPNLRGEELTVRFH